MIQLNHHSPSYAISGALGGVCGFAAGQLTFAYFALGLLMVVLLIRPERLFDARGIRPV